MNLLPLDENMKLSKDLSRLKCFKKTFNVDMYIEIFFMDRGPKPTPPLRREMRWAQAELHRVGWAGADLGVMLRL